MVDSLVILEDEEFDGLDDPISIEPFRSTYWTSTSLMSTALNNEDDSTEFLGGPPRVDVLYGEHPMRDQVWIPVADYHRLVFEDKVAEALELLMVLGARRVEAEHVGGWGREVAAELSLPVVGTDLDARTSGSSQSLFHADFEGGDPPASDEEFWNADDWDWRWAPHERLWHPIIEGRLAGRLRSCTLAVNFEQDWGLNGSVSGIVKRLGISLGGSYTEHRRTHWRLQVNF